MNTLTPGDVVYHPHNAGEQRVVVEVHPTHDWLKVARVDALDRPSHWITRHGWQRTPVSPTQPHGETR